MKWFPIRSISVKQALDYGVSIATILSLIFLIYSIKLQNAQINMQASVVRFGNAIAFSNYFQDAYRLHLLAPSDDSVSASFAAERINEGLLLLEMGIREGLADRQIACEIMAVAINYLEKIEGQSPQLPRECAE